MAGFNDSQIPPEALCITSKLAGRHVNMIGRCGRYGDLFLLPPLLLSLFSCRVGGRECGRDLECGERDGC